MNVRSIIYPPVASFAYRRYQKQAANIFALQKAEFQNILKTVKNTAFGEAHQFSRIQSYNEYRNVFPLQQYQNVEAFVKRASLGEANVLWPGKPLFIAQTSGTISGKKFIPISKAAFASQRMGRLVALANYSMAYQKLKHIKGPMVFFSGYSANEAFGKYQSNLVSAIMASNIPAWMRKYNLPSAKAAQIKDFDLRMAAIIRECIQARHHLRGMVTFPPWLLYFLEQLPKHTNASFSELFPNFGLLITSGMSYTPYRANTERLLGKTYDRLETYPTSEGFIGFTESLHNPGFSLMPANGMFFEFVHLKDVDNPYAKRYCLEEVECACPYAILVTTNAGLMSFLIGDSVEFISVNPPRMIITGRINRVISLVSENVSINDTDSCIHLFSHETKIHVYDYVCAGVHGNTPHYQWIISCDALPDKREILCEALHTCMKKTNTLYKHYSNDTLIGPPEIMWVKRNAFPTFMQQHGELDFQKKVEHICVDTAKFERYKSFMSQHQLNL